MRCVTCGDPNPRNLDPCPACGAGVAPAAPGPRSAAELEAAFAEEAADSPSARGGPLRPGQDFGTRYTILKLLGSGGMGFVYQALDRDLNVPVALKVLRPGDANPRLLAELQRRFKAELLLARRVTHKHVIRIHDIGEVDGIRFLTMPFVQGRDLAAILKNGPLPVTTALRYARQIAAGLAAAHAAGVIHRDLKPANVMIDQHDNALLMDFGIARSSLPGAAQRTVAGAVVGTAAYMAPEQARGEAIDHRADIYAFGLILYEMLTGPRHMPKGAVADLYARMTAPPVPTRAVNSAIPPGLDAVVTRCVQPQAADRYETTFALVQALAALSRRGHGDVPGQTSRGRRWRVPAAVAALLALLLGGGYWATRQTKTPSSPAGAEGRDAAADAGHVTGDGRPPAEAGAATPVVQIFNATTTIGTALVVAPSVTGVSEAPSAARALPPPPPPAFVQRSFARAAAARTPEGAGVAYARLSGSGPRAASYAAAGRADLEMMRRHHTQAAEMLERAIDMDIRARNLSATAPKYLALAEARLGEGQNEQALEAVEQALEVSRHESVLMPAARLFIALDHGADAEALAQEMAVAPGEHGAAYADLVAAELALDRGDAPQAVATLSDVVERDDLWMARYLRGTAYLAERRFDEAFADFEVCRLRGAEAASLFFDYMPTLRYLALLEDALAKVRDAVPTLNVATTGR